DRRPESIETTDLRRFAKSLSTTRCTAKGDNWWTSSGRYRTSRSAYVQRECATPAAGREHPCPTSRTPRLCGAAGYQPNRPTSAGHPHELADRGAGGLRLFRAGVPDQATSIQPTRHPLALSAQTALLLAERTGAARTARASGWRGVPDSDQGASRRRGGGDGYPPPQHLVSRYQPNLRGELRLPALRQTTAGTGLRSGDRRGVGSQCLPRRALRGDRPAAGTAHPTHRRFFRPGAHRHRAGARTLSDHSFLSDEPSPEISA